MTKEEFKNEIGKLKEKAREKTISTLNWVGDNPEITVAATALGGKLLWEAGRCAKRHQVEKLEKERRTRIWDPEVGTRWQLRREMNNREAREYQDRVRSGESRYDVLYDMGLLKRR